MTLPRISLLVAMAKNRIIGQNNQLPWHLPADLKHFKSLTMGHVIIMGRKTYESIGKSLPGRTNIVVTHQHQFNAQDAMVVHSIDDALKVSEKQASVSEIFVIGGEQLYRQTLPICQRIYITEIQRDFAGDTVFPEFDQANWQETERIQHVSESGDLQYHFVILDRRKPYVKNLTPKHTLIDD
ncbi:MAG TPA: dihydrofolate reductase [Nitrosomonas sp.]|nr:dihydrofolate reductase [Nitrosomonas sp.]